MLLYRGRNYYLVTTTKIKTEGSEKENLKNPLFSSPSSKETQLPQRRVASPFTAPAKSTNQTLMLA